jgi:hypothetical protein
VRISPSRGFAVILEDEGAEEIVQGHFVTLEGDIASAEHLAAAVKDDLDRCEVPLVVDAEDIAIFRARHGDGALALQGATDLK